MKFGPEKVSGSHDAILGHTIRSGNLVIRKGTIITYEEIAELQDAGIEEIIVARLEVTDLHEDALATILAQSAAGKFIHCEKATTGRSNLVATCAGLLKIREDIVRQINSIDDALTIATLPVLRRVKKGSLVATAKVIPFGADQQLSNKINKIDEACLSIAPFFPKKIGLINTRLPGMKVSLLDKTRRALDKRLENTGSHVEVEIRVEHSIGEVRKALGNMESRCDVFVLFGASAIVDENDTLPAAVRLAGGVIERFGMPVDPGNLLVLGSFGGKPVIGAPGCARSPLENGFDWVLNRVLADIEVRAKDMAGLGVGGLLGEIVTRPMPRQHTVQDHSFGSVGLVTAVVLAAGESRRMGRVNKMLVEVDGKPMIRHVVERALASRAFGVHVVVGHQAEKVRKALDGCDVRFVECSNYSAGLSRSLKSGIEALSYIEARGALVLLGDMPDVSTNLIDQMITSLDPANDGLIVLPVHDGKRGNPVLWSSRLFEDLKNLQGDQGGRVLFDRYHDAIVEVQATHSVLVDYDTPASLEILGTRVTADHKFTK